jgi:hypothetical protein
MDEDVSQWLWDVVEVGSTNPAREQSFDSSVLVAPTDQRWPRTSDVTIGEDSFSSGEGIVFQVRRQRTAAGRAMSLFSGLAWPSKRVCVAALATFVREVQLSLSHSRKLLQAAISGHISLAVLRIQLSGLDDRFFRVVASLRGGASFSLRFRAHLRTLLRELEHHERSLRGKHESSESVPSALYDNAVVFAHRVRQWNATGRTQPMDYLAVLSDLIDAVSSMDRSLRELFSTQIAAHVREIRTMSVEVFPTRLEDEPMDQLTQFIVHHEAVHPFTRREDTVARLGGRLDRLAFALIHPHMSTEPLAVVQIALIRMPLGLGVRDRDCTREVSSPSGVLVGPTQDLERDESGCIDSLLNRGMAPFLSSRGGTEHGSIGLKESLEADTAVFYSATNCHPDALQGLQLTSMLILLAQERLSLRFPRLTRFATLSPMPGFARWVDATICPILRNHGPYQPQVAKWLQLQLRGTRVPPTTLVDALDQRRLGAPVSDWPEVGRLLEQVAGLYLLYERRTDKEDGRLKALDPVENFHIQNGAIVSRICPGASNATRVSVSS